MEDIFYYIDIKPIFLNITKNSPTLKPFVFQKTNLVISEKGVKINIPGNTQNPYFTRDVEYPYNILKKMDYREQLEFFFEINKFKEILLKNPKFKEMEEMKKKIEAFEIKNKQQNISNSNTQGNQGNQEGNKEEEDSMKNMKDIYKKQIAINEEKNIKTMLTILFPTTFPVNGNIQFSLDSFIKNDPISIETNSFRYYSYLNIGKTYTILRTTWLNDFFNNSEFKDFVSTVKKYKKWYERQTENNLKDYLIKNVKNQIEELNLEEYLKTTIRKLENNKQKYSEILNNLKIFESTYKKTYNEKIKIDNIFNKKEDIYKLKKYFENVYDTYKSLKDISERNNSNILVYIDSGFLKMLKSIKDTIEKITLAEGVNDFLLDITSNKYKNYYSNYSNNNDNNDNYESIKNQIRKIYGDDQYYKKYTEKLKKFLKQSESLSNEILKGEIKNQLKNLSELTPFFQSINKLSLDNDGIETIYTGIIKNRINDKNVYGYNDNDNEKEKNNNKDFIEDVESYTISLFMDVIEGEINDKNIKEIECEYRNEYLGNTFLNLTSTSFISKYLIQRYSYPFISLENLKKTVKTKQNTLEKEAKKIKTVKNKEEKREEKRDKKNKTKKN